MKRLVLTFLSTAAVGAVLSASPVAAQDTVTGAPAGTAPVTVGGYENSSGPTGAPAIMGHATVEGYWDPSGHTGASITSNIDPTHALEPQCPVFRDFNDAEAKDAVTCSPD
jgi:hypothetical protein